MLQSKVRGQQGVFFLIFLDINSIVFFLTTRGEREGCRNIRKSACVGGIICEGSLARSSCQVTRSSYLTRDPSLLLVLLSLTRISHGCILILPLTQFYTFFNGIKILTKVTSTFTLYFYFKCSGKNTSTLYFYFKCFVKNTFTLYFYFKFTHFLLLLFTFTLGKF